MEPDVIHINGPFGVGKTTVARRLLAALGEGAFYDPEWTGRCLRGLGRVVPLRGRGTDDFQDIALWRRSVVLGIRLCRAGTRGPVVVPMTFYRLDYQQEMLHALHDANLAARCFCLVASTPTIRARLRQRGDDPDNAWFSSKVPVCAAAQVDPRFGARIATDARSVDDVVDEIQRRLH
jgi:predicted kinase